MNIVKKMPPQLSKKRASKADDYNSDDGFVEDAPKSNKRAKTSQPISKDKQLDDDGNPYWEVCYSAHGTYKSDTDLFK